MPCIWTEDGDGTWEASCNRGLFQFLDGDPKDNGFEFCPYCGKPLDAIPYEEDAKDGTSSNGAP